MLTASNGSSAAAWGSTNAARWGARPPLRAGPRWASTFAR